MSSPLSTILFYLSFWVFVDYQVGTKEFIAWVQKNICMIWRIMMAMNTYILTTQVLEKKHYHYFGVPSVFLPNQSWFSPLKDNYYWRFCIYFCFIQFCHICLYSKQYFIYFAVFLNTVFWCLSVLLHVAATFSCSIESPTLSSKFNFIFHSRSSIIVGSWTT